MSSIRDQIVARIITQLNGAGKPAGVPTAERTRSITTGEASKSLSVVPVRDIPEEIAGGRGPLVLARLTVAVEIRAPGTATKRSDEEVDESYAWAVKALVGSTLNGLAHDVLEGETSFEYERGDAPVCFATVEFIVQYQHLTDNAEAQT